MGELNSIVDKNRRTSVQFESLTIAKRQSQCVPSGDLADGTSPLESETYGAEGETGNC